MNEPCPHCDARSLVVDWPDNATAYCLLCGHRFPLAVKVIWRLGSPAGIRQPITIAL